MSQAYPVEHYVDYAGRARHVTALYKERNKAETQAEKTALLDQVKGVNKQSRLDQAKWYGQILSRWRHTPDGFRERLTLFWKDHFTALGKMGIFVQATQPYIEEAIRPNITGSFENLLISATTHPIMLLYLDQHVSVGPNSKTGLKDAATPRGLNENLAREVLELHTLGVDGPYNQSDVRSLALLFTGLSIDADKLFKFKRWIAEPGKVEILGKTYGGQVPSSEHVFDALKDLARHPATARHLAHKLAVHFTSDTPDPDLVQALTNVYTQTNGDLMAVYQTLLDHPSAWAPDLANVKPPFDYVASSCRALGIEATTLFDKELQKSRFRLTGPLAVMGQPWLSPSGPNGWPEEDEAWITPQGLSARIRWAMSVPRLLGVDLPEPADFVDTALGPYANDAVRFAASAAETRSEAIGLVLSSPAFQRR